MIIISPQAHGKPDCCGEGEATHAVIAQGATGRWCEVMWICAACAAEWAGGEEKIKDADTARELCDENGYADF